MASEYFEIHENEYQEMVDYYNFLEDMETDPWGDK